jgi:hypothetical protein
MSDTFVEEIHAIRREIAEECDHDLKKIGEYFMELQKRFPQRLVRPVRRAKSEAADERE